MMRTPSVQEDIKPANLGPEKLDSNQSSRALPWFEGRRWFPVFWCVSKPYNYRVVKTANGGGGKGGKGGTGTTSTGYCDVAGLVACGMGDWFEMIEVNGKIVWAGGIARDGTHVEHSGDIVVSGVGTFRLHWGTSTAAGAWLVLNSGGEEHPYYRDQIVFEAQGLNCGSSESVPNIRVLLERAPRRSGLDENRSREGANPATGACELLENDFFGIGVTGALDVTPTAALTSDLQARTKTVSVPGDPTHTAQMSYVSAAVTERTTFAVILASLLEGFDGWARRNGELLCLGRFTHIGSPTGLTELSLHDLAEDPEFPNPGPDDSSIITDAIVTGYNRDRNMEDDWQSASNEATRDRLKETRPRTFSRGNFCTLYQLKEQGQELVNFYAVPAEEFPAKFRRERLGSLGPGDRFILNYGPSSSRVVYRITRRRDKARGGVSELSIIADRGLAPLAYVAPADPTPALPDPEPPVVVVDARIFQAPLSWAGDPTPTVIPLVSRPAGYLLGFKIFYSADDVTYDEAADSQGWAIKGTLVSGITSGASTATLTLSGYDMALLVEQSTPAQQDDTLLLFVDGEIMSIGTVTALGAGQYALGLLRGRLGTLGASHSTSAIGYVIPRSACLLLQHANFPRTASGRYFKLPTYTASEQQALASALRIPFTFAATGVSSPSSLSATAIPLGVSLACTLPTDGDLAAIEIWERSASTPVPVDGDTPDIIDSIPAGGGAYKYVRSGLPSWTQRWYWCRLRDSIAGKSAIVAIGNATTLAANTPFTPVLTNLTDLGGGRFLKSGGTTNTWDSQVYSAEAYVGGAFVSFKGAPGNHWMVGLNTDPATDASYTSIDYAWYVNAAQAQVYESGTLKFTSSVTLTSSSVLSLTYDGLKIRYFIDGVLQYTSDSTSIVPGMKLYLDSSVYELSATIGPIQFGPMGAAGGSQQGFFCRACSDLGGGSIIKNTGSGAWDADAYSLESYVGGAFASFQFGTLAASVMAGLNTDPATDSSYSSIDFAWFADTAGNAQVYEGGSAVTGTWARSAGDVFSVQYDGSSVKYFQNGVLRYTSAAPPAADTRLYFDSSIFTVGGRLNNIRFGPQGASSVSYWIKALGSMSVTSGGSFTPASITPSALYAFGTNAPLPYAGRFIIADAPAGGSYTDRYTSSSDESSHTFSPTNGSVRSIRVRLYLAGGTTTLVDEQYIAVAEIGNTGSTGAPGAPGAPGGNGTNGATVLGSAGGGGSGSGTSYGNISPSLQVTVTCDGNPRVVQLMGGYIANAGPGNRTLYAALYRDSTLVAEFGGSSGISGVPSGLSDPMEFSGVDTPSAGSHTFYLKVKTSDGLGIAAGGVLTIF